MALYIKRIYDAPASTDGYRVLVDRLWPRGLTKQRAAIDLWLKDIAPSPGLRTWFGHDPAKFAEFRIRYTNELRRNSTVETLVDSLHQQANTTLLYATTDPNVNHAAVLRDFLLANE